MSQARTLVLLGGSAQQVVAIQAARACGYRTVVCDYLPDNPGQHHADAFHLVSTTDRDAVLTVARAERAQGIVAYSSDPAAPTAAYVAEALGLPTNPYASVEKLSVKTLFREHLREHGFPCPASVAVPAGLPLPAALDLVRGLSFPIVVKPSDSSGSKGVSVVDGVDGLADALAYARPFGRNGILIAEEHIASAAFSFAVQDIDATTCRMAEAAGFACRPSGKAADITPVPAASAFRPVQSAPHVATVAAPRIVGGDIFVKDGRVCFWGLASCVRRREFPLLPMGEAMPALLTAHEEAAVKRTLQDLVASLDLRFGELNVEVMIGADATPYILELGARAGGGMLPVQLTDMSGIDLVRANVMCAMGDDPGDLSWSAHEPCISTCLFHADSDGAYGGLALSGEAAAACYREVAFVELGAPVRRYANASDILGVLFFRFADAGAMYDFMAHITDHVKVVVR